MHRSRVLLTALATAGASLALGAAPALAKELRVSNNNSCPNAAYTTIQSAVTAAGPGDTVKVCPGTYPEQVTIGPGKNGLRLESLKPLQATIQFPPLTTPPNALVRVNQATDVRVTGFTISGPYTDGGCVGPLDTHYGVRVDGGGSATIAGNHITQIRDANPAFAGCQDGVAVLVGRSFEATTGTGWVVGNWIDNYQKNGPTVDNAGSYGNVSGNAIDGGGANNIIARNGVQIGRGAGADVDGNTIWGNSYTGTAFPPPAENPDDNDATGILVFSVTNGVEVGNNYAFQNDLGIDVGTASGVLVRNNLATNNVFNGLRAESDTSGNVFAENRARDNGAHDCYDGSVGAGTAGTANTWKNDKGVTQQPPGICRPNGDN